MKWNMFIDTTRKNFRFDAYPRRIRFYKAIFGEGSKIEREIKLSLIYQVRCYLILL